MTTDCNERSSEYEGEEESRVLVRAESLESVQSSDKENDSGSSKDEVNGETSSLQTSTSTFMGFETPPTQRDTLRSVECQQDVEFPQLENCQSEGNDVLFSAGLCNYSGYGSVLGDAGSKQHYHLGQLTKN